MKSFRQVAKSSSGPSCFQEEGDSFKRRPAGLKLREYTFEETIGEGTFGKVKKATHKSTGAQVAIKVIDKRRIIKPSSRSRIVKEINILQKLDHPNIIELYEVVDSRKYIFLIMEYVPRGELFDYIVKHGRLMEWQACRFFHQLIDAVEYIHSMHIVHRDLKPENMLLDEKLGIKICDFGLGNVNENGLLFKTACGSPCYVAPEMISGGNYEGSGADVWACGVILYAMLCGFLPFEDTGNLPELYDLIFEAKYEIPPFVSRDAENLISKILVVDPTKRYTIKQIRRHRWYKLLPDENAKKTCNRLKGKKKEHKEAKIAQTAIKELSSFYKANIPLGSPKTGRKSSAKYGRTASGNQIPVLLPKSPPDSVFTWIPSPSVELESPLGMPTEDKKQSKKNSNRQPKPSPLSKKGLEAQYKADSGLAGRKQHSVGTFGEQTNTFD